MITDAIIPIKSEDTDCDKEIVEPASKIENINENANSTDKYDDDIVSAKENTTGNSKTQQIAANENTHSALTNCKENFTDCTETKSKSNKINDDVTILKYNINPEKTKGHAKNSIKRKKRSLNIYTENAKSAKSVPIVNYVTSHSPKDIELIERNTGNVIRGAALADFNIETLHNNVNTKKNDKENSNNDLREDISESNSQENSEENNKENIDDIHQRKPYNVNENSDKIREHKALDRLPKGSEESEESNERYNDKSIQNKNAPYSTSFTDGNESREVDKSDLLVHPDDYNERGEKYYNTDDTRSTYKKPVNDSRESDERENYEHQEKSSFKNRPTSPENSKNDFKSDSRPSTDNSDESEEDTIIIMTKKNRKPFGSGRDGFSSEIKEQGSTTAIPIKIQDVDLRDFSYERIQVNADGVVEPAKYELDNYDEISPLTTIKPNKDQHNSNKQYEKSIEEDDSPLSGEINEGSNQPIHLNDGEVKPVVEIDRDSRESSEERSKEAIVVDLPNEDSSLETFLGVKEIQSEEQKDKIISSSKQEETGDVKQEFERIPLNYHHDKKQKEQESKDISSTQAESTPVSDSEEATRNDGTLDTFQPHGPRYDENLNIKFSDLTIKLPEIKLPEDILAYAYETPEHTKKNKDKDQGKSRLFHYDDEGEDNSGNAKKSNENNSDHDDDDDDHYPGYHYDYYGYQKKNDALEKRKKDDEEDNEEDEDLYEKFVRERFGKRGSYEKRSEKLQMRPVKENAKLYQTLQQVLKQTEDIQKQADKSDDPNAGYMWTLEYGHAL